MTARKAFSTNMLSHQANNKLLNHLKNCTMFIQECDNL